MNIFNKLVQAEHENDTRLGLPSTSPEHFIRRKTVMEQMAGGKGFRTPAREVRRFADGTTRGERRRALRAAANARVSEARSYLFLHSAARRRLLEQQALAA